VDRKTCAYCGKKFSDLGWPHIEGDSNRGVFKIEHFCCEEHKELFFYIKRLSNNNRISIITFYHITLLIIDRILPTILSLILFSPVFM